MAGQFLAVLDLNKSDLIKFSFDLFKLCFMNKRNINVRSMSGQNPTIMKITRKIINAAKNIVKVT